MRALGDLTGKTFNWWTVVGPAPNQGSNRMWRCICRCGTERDIFQINLTAAKSWSCGCRQPQLQQQVGYGLRKYEGDMIHSKEYKAWIALKERCSATQGYFFTHYVQRGITVCDRWQASFMDFLADMGKATGPKYSVGRINNERGYSPDNCRWETRTQQNRNKRNVPFVEWNGESRTLPEWAEVVGISYATLNSRIYLGWSIDEALTRPQRGKGVKVKYNMHRHS